MMLSEGVRAKFVVSVSCSHQMRDDLTLRFLLCAIPPSGNTPRGSTKVRGERRAWPQADLSLTQVIDKGLRALYKRAPPDGLTSSSLHHNTSTSTERPSFYKISHYNTVDYHYWTYILI